VREPLLLPLAALAGGILLARFTQFERDELLLILATFGALTLLSVWLSQRRAAILSAGVLLFFAGVFTAELHRPGPPPELNAEAGEMLILDGCIVEPPITSEDRERFVMELAPNARARVSLIPRDGEVQPLLQYGQRVEVDARIRMPRNFHNPGAFDYVGYLARQHVYWTANARGVSAVRVLPGRCGSRFWAALYGLRTRALRRLESLYANDAYSTAIMQAMLLGESSRVEKIWTEDFRRTGTYHALVISGLHITVLAAALLFLLRICLLPRDAALLLAVAGAWLYALVSGWQPPVIRSAGGFTLFAVASLVFRRGRILNLLAATALVILGLDPEQLFEASFQLSFLSVAAIGAFAIPVLDATSSPRTAALRGIAEPNRDFGHAPAMAQYRIELRLIAQTIALWTRTPLVWCAASLSLFLRGVFYLYDLLIVSAAVQLGLALPMIAYFHSITLSSISANLLVVPLLSAAVPAGFLAIFTGWTVPAALAGVLLAGARRVTEWHAIWEPHWRLPSPPLWLAILFAISLIALAAAIRLRPRIRRPAAALAVSLLVLLCCHPVAPQPRARNLELDAIDVGQGDSMLVTFPGSQRMLIDSGGIPVFGKGPKPKLDIGEDVVSPYLWGRAIRGVDVLVSTHAHEDHTGGMAALIENFRPRQLWTGANPDCCAWTAIRAQAERFGVKIVSMRAGKTFDYGGARIDVLAPFADYEPSSAPSNNDSLVLRITYGRHKFLLTGDLERQVERRLVEEQAIGRVDVLKVAHHGSKSSSSAEFLDAARPAIAIFSVGDGNLYGHPHPSVLDRFAGQHTAVFRTDVDGLVSIQSDGDKLNLSTYRWSDARTPASRAFGAPF